MAAKRKRRRAPKGHPRGKTVKVRAYCRGFARRFRASGKNQRGEDMPF